MLHTAKKLRQVVHAFKKNPNESELILSIRLQKISETVNSTDFIKTSFKKKLAHCQVLFELLDVQDRLPSELRKTLWKLFLVYQVYKSLLRKEGQVL